MAAKGDSGAAADEIWEKLQGFATFGFPESHSVSFAYIVYMSAWLKYHWPAEYLAGLLNAQPMGFYSPNSLVQDARRHGVVVSLPTSTVSWHDCTIEPIEADPDDVGGTPGRLGGGGGGRSKTRPALRSGCGWVCAMCATWVRRRSPGSRPPAILGGEFTSPRGPGAAHRARGGCPGGSRRRRGTGVARARSPGGDVGGGRPGRDRPERLALSPGIDPPASAADDRLRRNIGPICGQPASPIAIRPVRPGPRWGCLTVAEALDVAQRSQVEVAGVVTHRQRPGTAKGVISSTWKMRPGCST